MAYDEVKFWAFNELLRQTGPGGILSVVDPRVLGDTQDELLENLDRIAAAGLLVKITPRDKRPKSTGSLMFRWRNMPRTLGE